MPAAELVGSGLARADWLEQRKHGLGGSDIAALLGLSPWRNPLSLYLDKRGELEADSAETEYQRWGHILEVPITQAFMEDNADVDVERLPVETMYRSNECEIALVSPDGIAVQTGAERAPSPGVPAVFEAKCTSAFRAEVWQNGVPPYYEAQGQWAMAVTGLDRCFYGVLIGGNSFKSFVIDADRELHADLFERAVEFWQLVKSGRVPDIDGTRQSTDAIKRAFRHSEPLMSAEGGELLKRLLDERRHRKQMLKLAQEAVDETDNRVKYLLGGAEQGTIDGRRAVTWTSYERKGYYVEPTEVRPLIVAKAFK